MRLNKSEKEALRQAFSVPAPKKKRAFLRTLPKQETGLDALVLSQASYIRKWVWAVSFLIFGIVVLPAHYVNRDVIWILSGVMPFAALLIIMEFAKSSAYGMAELEMSSRFSLKTILLARMILLGAVQLLGLLVAAIPAGATLFVNGSYLLVPYMLTAMLGLIAVRRLHGREGLFACGSIAAVISVVAPMSHFLVPVLYAQENRMLWVLGLLLLVAGFVKEYKRTINHLEEFTWN